MSCKHCTRVSHFQYLVVLFSHPPVIGTLAPFARNPLAAADAVFLAVHEWTLVGLYPFLRRLVVYFTHAMRYPVAGFSRVFAPSYLYGYLAVLVGFRPGRR